VGRPPGSKNKKTLRKERAIPLEELNKMELHQLEFYQLQKIQRCVKCDRQGSIFYKSYNSLHAKLKQFPYCKDCMQEQFDKYLYQFKSEKKALFYWCRKFDLFFSLNILDGAISQAKKGGWSLIRSYMKLLNSFKTTNGYGSCFDESGAFAQFSEHTQAVLHEEEDTNNEDLNDEEKANMADIIRIYGYDPFENEVLTDRKKMYSKLVDYMDESTQEDNFKLPVVVQIVTNFNQVEKIDKTIAGMDITNQINDIKILTATKNDIIKATLSMAKDNGISVNHSNNKSKGAGTLSGILKSLQDKNIRESDVNLFDLQTCKGIKQVADISNKSILDQLSFDENDYTEMIKEQRALVQSSTEKAEKLEEENRLLKLELQKQR